MQTPDNVIGETLVVSGRVEFKNLLRIDGHFEVSPYCILKCRGYVNAGYSFSSWSGRVLTINILWVQP